MPQQDLKVENSPSLFWAKAITSKPRGHAQHINAAAHNTIRKGKVIRKMPVPITQSKQKQQKPKPFIKSGKLVAKVRQRCQSASSAVTMIPTPTATMINVPTEMKSVPSVCMNEPATDPDSDLDPDTSLVRFTSALVSAPAPAPASTLLSTRCQSAPQRRAKSVCSRPPPTALPYTRPTPQIQMDTLNCPNHTSTDYWDNWATDWNGEIISSIDDDLNGVIKIAIAKYCSTGPSSLALDFGCGVGLYLPYLAERSESVLGLDISRKLIAIARRSCETRGFTNVRLKKTDLGTCDIRKMKMENIATFAVCANVLISPEPCTRRSIIANLAAVVQPEGYVLLIVPATKSARLIEHAHGIWLAERHRLRLKTEKSDLRPETSTNGDVKRGIYRRDDVRTKHYREKEIRSQLQKVKLEVVEVQRVEYSWLTEFDAPVDILEECLDEKPFDWLVIAKRLL